MQLTERDELALRVEQGAEWLDGQMPGWELKIDPAELRLQSCYSCILGQIYEVHHCKGHNYELEEIDEDADPYDIDYQCDSGFDFAVEHLLEKDFEISRNMGFSGGTEQYPILQELWLELIKDRLNKGVSV
jgi:hypothetical protein